MASIFDFLQPSAASQQPAAPVTLFDIIRRSALNQRMAPTEYDGQAAQQVAPAPQIATNNQPSPLDTARWPFGPVGSPSQVTTNNQPSPLDTAQWPAGPVGAPSQAMAQMPATMAQRPAADGPDVGSRLFAGAQSFANSKALIPALFNGIAGLTTGRRMDPQGVALQRQEQAQNMTAKALVAKGVDPQIAMAAINSPDLMKALIAQHFGAGQVQNLGNGYVWQNGKAVRAYEPEDKTPAGFEKMDGGGMRPIPGGPADLDYIKKKEQTSGTTLPSGFERDPTSGTLRPITGGPADPAYLRSKGDRQNAPSGYSWNDPNDPTKGVTPIPGGPGEKVDAEVAGRLGLAKSFLGQLPDIKKRVEAGGITGPVNAAKAYIGSGEPGEIRRQMDSGAEALLRMLTGAGMNMQEASEYTRRYRFDPTDQTTTVLSKLTQLERELNSVGETVGRGRGGWQPSTHAPAASPAPANIDNLLKKYGGS